jgi:hypothetical protein
MNFTDYLGGARTNVSSSALEYKPIDTDGTISRMQIIQRAKERGKLEQPAPETTGFDSVEQEIINQIEMVGKEQFDTYLAKQQTYSDRASHTGVQGLSAEIAVVANDAKADFIREVHTGVDRLHAMKRDVVQTEKELELFRVKHHITRSVRNQGSYTAHRLILLFVIAIESVVNGVFLQKGNLNGLAGGILYALVIACLNITIGFSAGRFIFPWTNYRGWGIRILAGLATLVYLAGAFFFNMVVAHYRNATASNPFDASAIAYQHVISNPFGLHDVESWALFAVGVTFSLFAAFDAFGMDDPYPGYGTRVRQNLDALDDYSDAKDVLLSNLEDIKQAAEKKMDGVLNTIRARHSERLHINLKSLAERAAILQQFSILETAANTILRRYRDENIRTRSAKAPTHFDMNWRYTPPSPDSAVVSSIGSEIYEVEVQKATDALSSGREGLHSGYLAALSEYRRIEDMNGAVA